jgi:hypothetical protein
MRMPMPRTPTPKRYRAKPSPVRKRNLLAVRVRDELKTMLEATAQTYQRSLSEEAERRLEDSITVAETSHRAFDLAFGRDTTALLLVLAKVMKTTGEHAAFAVTHSLDGGSKWLSEPYAYDQVVQAISAVLEMLRPEGEIRAPTMKGGPAELAGLYEYLGVGFARGILAEVAEQGLASGDEWTAPVRARLGHDLLERLKQNATSGRSRAKR